VLGLLLDDLILVWAAAAGYRKGLKIFPISSIIGIWDPAGRALDSSFVWCALTSLIDKGEKHLNVDKMRTL
jgi:hypothetical protein